MLNILEKRFKEGMKNKDFNSFKKSYPTLLNCILLAMNDINNIQISKKLFRQYTLQKEAITLMYNYKRKYGLSKSDKLLLKGLQRYFTKLEKNNLTPDVGDVVINKQILKYYRNRYKL